MNKSLLCTAMLVTAGLASFAAATQAQPAAPPVAEPAPPPVDEPRKVDPATTMNPEKGGEKPSDPTKPSAS